MICIQRIIFLSVDAFMISFIKKINITRCFNSGESQCYRVTLNDRYLAVRKDTLFVRCLETIPRILTPGRKIITHLTTVLSFPMAWQTPWLLCRHPPALIIKALADRNNIIATMDATFVIVARLLLLEKFPLIHW